MRGIKPPAGVACILGGAYLCRGRPEIAREHLRSGLGFFARRGNEKGALAGMQWAVQLCSREARWEPAARLLGAIDAIRQRLGSAVFPGDVSWEKEMRVAACSALGAVYYAVECETGRTTPLLQIITDALASQNEDE